MKRREFLKLSATLTGAAMTVYLPAGWTPAGLGWVGQTV